MITTIITYIPTIAEYYFYYKMLDLGIKCASYLNITVKAGRQFKRFFVKKKSIYKEANV